MPDPTTAHDGAPRTYTDADYEPWLEVDSGVMDRIARILTVWWWKLGYQLKAFGLDNLPATGAYVLVPNHSSWADPFLHASPQKRHLRFMAKDTLMKNPVMGFIVRNGGGFPVRRGKGDQFAMELARRLLRAGHPVVVYPEGTRFRASAELGPAKRGFARLALEVGVPIVPCATWGVKERHIYGRPRWRRPRATTVYGEPISFDGLEPTPENVDHVRDVVWQRVHELYDDARRLDFER
ncbi:MAG: 1-acyl-sn-glycerol-3-phosphate acyltransferase [Thermoleophilia bacterium]|nr:1-acyl-sn-glycerol-3-phosphate acyltransferase [Thermoleophilia bacterium]